MKQVPVNKIVYIGGRRYVEGDILPPHLFFGTPILTKKQVKKIETELIKELEEPKKRRGRPRKK